MNYPNEIRNRAIVLLRKVDPDTYKYKVLGELMPIKTTDSYRPMHVSTVERIYKRDYNKYNLQPTSKAVRQSETLSKNGKTPSEFSVVEDK